MNIGKVNFMMANSQTLNEGKFNDYLNTIKNSEILLLEFKTITNIENKFIENDLIASKYIDNNIKLFEVFTIDEFETEHNKLNKFVDDTDNVLTEEKNKLYDSIVIVISENIKCSNDVDVNKLHEAYEYILNHIKTPKVIGENYSDENDFINENILKTATNKFNEKYSTFSDTEKKLFSDLITLGYNAKTKILETYKKEILTTLNEINSNSDNPNIKTAIDKINTMAINQDNINENLIKLHEFKNNII